MICIFLKLFAFGHSTNMHPLILFVCTFLALASTIDSIDNQRLLLSIKCYLWRGLPFPLCHELMCLQTLNTKSLSLSALWLMLSFWWRSLNKFFFFLQVKLSLLAAGLRETHLGSSWTHKTNAAQSKREALSRNNVLLVPSNKSLHTPFLCLIGINAKRFCLIQAKVLLICPHL